MPFLVYTSSHRELTYKTFMFSGGEIQVKLDNTFNQHEDAITIQAHLTSSEKIMELVLLVDALRRLYGSDRRISLVCPYVPYARQDRVMNPGETLAVAVMCKLINSLQFGTVTVWDVHSDVTLALLDNVVNFTPGAFVQIIPVNKANTILVAPDAGAQKKVSAVAKGLGFEMITAEKKRDTMTGEITGTVVHSEAVGDKDFLIVDDICDGGRTFTELAMELKKLTTGRILLYVTHGIFSKGFEPFAGLIDHIYTATPFPNVDLSDPLVTHLRWPQLKGSK